MPTITPPGMPDDDGALEGPDLEVPTSVTDGTAKPAGIGDDGTVLNHPDGLAAGYSDTDSHFNPEEDTPTR